MEWFKRIYPIFIKFFRKNNIPYHDNLIYYILSRDKDEKVVEKIASIHLTLKEIVMSAAERLRQEGERMGVQKGRQEGENSKAIAIAKSMLKNGEPIDKIISYTGLTKKIIRSIS
ncbi:MAG: hypothetical protein K2X94_02440 [Amoebophilaceae bacterium]|nr:hypothetical protein [Amoebophilaceae bacterium]